MIKDRGKMLNLVKAAKRARRRSYSPYSGYSVGAALLAAGSKGRIFVGCNIENASYGATLCAERVAFATALASGERRFAMLAIAVGGGSPVPPCGLCLQFMTEFCNDLPIVLAAEGGGEPQVTSLRQLLPVRFDPKEVLAAIDLSKPPATQDKKNRST